MKTLVTANFTAEGLKRLRGMGMEVSYQPWSATNEIALSEDLAERLKALGAEGLILEVDLCHEEVFEAVPLKFIGCCRGEPINVDLDEATSAGVPVFFTPGRNAAAVADLTLAMILCALRPLIAAHNALASGDFNPGSPAEFMEMFQGWTGWELSGKTVGVVGLGAVGSRVARRLVGFGPRLLAHDPFAPAERFREFGATSVPLLDLFKTADIVTIHAAINDDTEGMIGRELIEAMKPGAIFINLARAELIDDDALYEALAARKIARAGLDVFRTEPPTRDNRFLKLDNVIATPHLGGATHDVIRHQTDMIIADLEAFLGGRPPKYCANPEVLRAK